METGHCWRCEINPIQTGVVQAGDILADRGGIVGNQVGSYPDEQRLESVLFILLLTKDEQVQEGGKSQQEQCRKSLEYFFAIIFTDLLQMSALLARTAALYVTKGSLRNKFKWSSKGFCR